MKLCQETVTVYNARVDPAQRMEVYEPTVLQGVSWYSETVSAVVESGLKAAKDFFDNLDTKQIATDIKAFLAEVDWAGIAQTIWDFLVSALKAIGSLLWELLVNTEAPPETAAAVEKEVEQLMSKYHPELVVTWGIDLESGNGQEQYDALVKAFQDGLAGKEFKVPAGLNIPPESIAACYNEMVEEWNKNNPDVPLTPILPEDVDKLIEGQLDDVEAEVPVDPTLPDDAGKKVQKEWDKQDADLETDVDPNLPNDAGKKVKKDWDKQDTDLEADVTPAFDKDEWNKKWKEITGNSFSVEAAVSLVKNGWTTIAGYVGTAVTTAVSLSKNGWTTIAGFVGTAVTTLISLGRNGWSSIAGFVGTAVTTAISLKKNGWSTIAGYIGTAVTTAISLSKSGWSTIADYIGTAVTTAISLSRDGWTSISDFIGTAITVAAKLENDDEDKYTPAKIFGTKLTVESKLKNADKEKYTPSKIFGTSITVSATLAAASGTIDKLKKAIQTALSKIKVGVSKKALGGAITDGGRQVAFASGGVIRGGLARYLEAVPHYAAGTSKAHGTVFVAGEAGPEIMGHINGRTEILNKSQLASAIYAAVVAGMAQAVNALGAFLGSRMTECANAIVATLANVAGPGMAPGVDFHMPAVAAGAVLPYEVAAQVARTGADLQGTLDANNEDLIQTLISVVGSQTAAILSALQAIQRQGDRGYAGPTSQGIINEINRRTQMFGASPLQGV